MTNSKPLFNFALCMVHGVWRSERKGKKSFSSVLSKITYFVTLSFNSKFCAVCPANLCAIVSGWIDDKIM